jgi:hypothetical protein
MDDFNWLNDSGTLTESQPALSPVKKKRKRSKTRHVPSLTLNCNVAKPRPLPQPMYRTPLQQLQAQHPPRHPQLYSAQHSSLQPKRQFQRPGVQQQYEIQQEQYDKHQHQYDIPQQQYDIPRQQYSIPQQQYGIPQQQYGIPQQQYGIPQNQINRFTQRQNTLPQYPSPQYPSPSPFKLSDSPFLTDHPGRSLRFHVTHKTQSESIVLTPMGVPGSSQFSISSSVLRSAQAFLQDSPLESPESVCVPFCKALDIFTEKVKDLCHLVREPTSERAAFVIESIEAEKEMVDREYIALRRRWLMAQQTSLKSEQNQTIHALVDPALSNREVTISSSSLSLASSMLQNAQEAFPSTKEHFSSTQNPFSGTLDLLWGTSDLSSNLEVGASFTDASLFCSFASQQPPGVQTDISSNSGQEGHN